MTLNPLVTKLTLLAACGLAAAATAHAADWRSQPGVAPILAMQEEVDRAVSSGRFPTKRCSVGDLQIAVRFEGEQPRKYEVQIRTGEHTLNQLFFYDAQGRLRSSYVLLKTRRGLERETRTLFNPDRSVLYRDQRVLKGVDEQIFVNTEEHDPRASYRNFCPDSAR